MIAIKKILCPVDFYPASTRAVDYAVALSRNYDATLFLLHVVTPTVPAAYEAPIGLNKLIDAMNARATSEMKEVLRRVKAKHASVESILRTGDVDLEIQTFLKEQKPDLVVMGTHGRHGLEKWFMGSHTERLLRRVNVPLLTIGRSKAKPAPPAIRRILVTTDFSEGTTDATRYAFSIARECRAKVTVLHVLNDISADLSGRYRDPLIKSIREKLERLVPDDARDDCDVRTLVVTGSPVRRILNIVKRDKIDLLVMNIHGKGILDRALLGSTADRIVRGAPAPVLLIPPMRGIKRQRRALRKAA